MQAETKVFFFLVFFSLISFSDSRVSNSEFVGINTKIALRDEGYT